MPNQIWSPEEGDEVEMKSGRVGIVGDIDTFVWDGGNDWQVTVTVPPGEQTGDEDEEEEEVFEDHLIRYDEAIRGWKEV